MVAQGIDAHVVPLDVTQASSILAAARQIETEFSRLNVLVNTAVDPGYTATDLNGNRGTRSVEQGAATAVHLATLPADGPTGGFFDEMGAVPW